MNFHKDQLEEMISSWNEAQLNTYIEKLEEREKELHAWLIELRRLRKGRSKRVTVDTGERSGT